ncbi:hypothetical protein MTR67_025974 [Solanum verrucosum]|uniref:Uncharacterized protein n=1 Tax=Solanum verrucosum TaxID=315347 RepID=A0AAF0TUD1_SOLVR|nr:hypothetical protein MTR67_025974 [Solanum verrucosum]
MGEATQWLVDLQKESITSLEELTDVFYLLLQCPTHGISDNVLSQYFYRSLISVNKGVADQLIRGEIMQQPFDMASTLTDELTKINRAWYTREDQLSP